MVRSRFNRHSAKGAPRSNRNLSECRNLARGHPCFGQLGLPFVSLLQCAKHWFGQTDLRP